MAISYEEYKRRKGNTGGGSGGKAPTYAEYKRRKGETYAPEARELPEPAASESLPLIGEGMQDGMVQRNRGKIQKQKRHQSASFIQTIHARSEH